MCVDIQCQRRDSREPPNRAREIERGCLATAVTLHVDCQIGASGSARNRARNACDKNFVKCGAQSLHCYAGELLRFLLRESDGDRLGLARSRDNRGGGRESERSRGALPVFTLRSDGCISGNAAEVVRPVHERRGYCLRDLA